MTSYKNPAPRKTKPVPKFRRVTPEERRFLLIKAGLACLARDGILGFTIDRICAEAQVSRGLITHHFKSKDGLLAAIHETMIGRLLLAVENPGRGASQIADVIDASFPSDARNRDTLRIWLTLWGEIANNPALLRAHRRQYARYRSGVEAALRALAGKRKRHIDIPFAALMFISLVDGLWLSWCIDPRQVSVEAARAACRRLLEPFFGRIG